MDTAPKQTISKSQQKKLKSAQFNIDREVRIKRAKEDAEKKALEILEVADVEKAKEDITEEVMQEATDRQIQTSINELQRLRYSMFKRSKKRLTKHKPSRTVRVKKRKAARKARAITRNS